MTRIRLSERPLHGAALVSGAAITLDIDRIRAEKPGKIDRLQLFCEEVQKSVAEDVTKEPHAPDRSSQ